PDFPVASRNYRECVALGTSEPGDPCAVGRSTRVLMQPDTQSSGGVRPALAETARRGWRIARTACAWRIWHPGHARFLSGQLIHRRRNRERGHDDLDHVRAAAEWLAAAQDSQPDGGISGRYHLARGWTSSYPETTGYTVPTLLAVAEALEEPAYIERARRCV